MLLSQNAALIFFVHAHSFPDSSAMHKLVEDQAVRIFWSQKFGKLPQLQSDVCRDERICQLINLLKKWSGVRDIKIKKVFSSFAFLLKNLFGIVSEGVDVAQRW